MSDISILFALDAEDAMLRGEFDEAIKLCENGIKVFPDYIAARSIYIKSLLLSNQIGKAKYALMDTIARFPLTKDIEFIKIELDKFNDEEYTYTPTNDEIIDSPEIEIQSLKNSNDSIEENEKVEDYDLLSTINFDEFESSALQNDNSNEEIETNFENQIENLENIDIDSNINPEVNSTVDKIESQEFEVETEIINENLLENIENLNPELPNIEEDIIEDISFEDVEDTTATNSIIEVPVQFTSIEIENNAHSENFDYNINSDLDYNKSLDIDNSANLSEILIESQTNPVNESEQKSFGNLRFVSLNSMNEKKREIRALNLKLIPGLEFSALRIGETKLSYTNHFINLPEPPEWGWHSNDEYGPIFRVAALEQDLDAPAEIIYTETMANIYELHGAKDIARKVYQYLAENEPHRKDEFLQKSKNLN